MDNKVTVKKKKAEAKVPKAKAVTVEKPKPKEDIKPTSTPKPEAEKPLTLLSLQKELEALKQIAQDHTQMIADLQSELSRKRKPTANGKVQIKDKQTGKVYPSKNSCYQSLLKAGELKDLVDKGTFGLQPEKNTFGWYALVRALPDRFEEIKSAEEKFESTDDADKKCPVPESQ